MRRATIPLLFASMGCSAGVPAAAPIADDAGAAGGPDGAIPTSCGQPPDGGASGSTCVLEAKGHVSDLSGAALGNLVMTFCGSACFGGRSDDAGSYSIPIGLYVDTANYAVHADGRPDHAVDYFRLSAGEPAVIATNMRLPLLPPSSVLLPPDGASTSSNVTVGDVTLVVAAGTTFDLDIEDYGNGNAGRTFRVAPVSLANAPPYAAAAKVAAIYALAPSGATPSIPMGVILKNSAGLPASSAVDVLVLGDNYFSTPPNVGTLSVQASAHVSADGQTIQTDPGQGISEITWLAVRGKGP